MTGLKIVVDLPAGDEASAETMWCVPLSGGRYRIQNVPVWAYGLALDDIVEGRVEDDRRVHFVRLLEKSGLLTVRAAGPENTSAAFEQLISVLELASEAAEKYSARYWAFAMQPSCFSAIEPEIRALEQGGDIFVEIANSNDELTNGDVASE